MCVCVRASFLALHACTHAILRMCVCAHDPVSIPVYLYVCMFQYKLYEQVYLLMSYYFLFFFLPFFPSVALFCKFQKKRISSPMSVDFVYSADSLRVKGPLRLSPAAFNAAVSVCFTTPTCHNAVHYSNTE